MRASQGPCVCARGMQITRIDAQSGRTLCVMQRQGMSHCEPTWIEMGLTLNGRSFANARGRVLRAHILRALGGMNSIRCDARTFWVARQKISGNSWKKFGFEMAKCPVPTQGTRHTVTVSDTPAKLPENAAALVASMALTDVATMRLWPQALAKPQLSWSLQYGPESVSSQMPAESDTETWLPSPAASHLLFLLFF